MSSVKEKLKRIFGYRKFFSSDECTIDSLIRIDDEIYDCDKCVLLDTIHTIRIMCPLTMKRETRILK